MLKITKFYNNKKICYKLEINAFISNNFITHTRNASTNVIIN